MVNAGPHRMGSRACLARASYASMVNRVCRTRSQGREPGQSAHRAVYHVDRRDYCSHLRNLPVRYVVWCLIAANRLHWRHEKSRHQQRLVSLCRCCRGSDCHRNWPVVFRYVVCRMSAARIMPSERDGGQTESPGICAGVSGQQCEISSYLSAADADRYCMKEGPDLRPALPAQTPAVWTTRRLFADDYFRAELTLEKVVLSLLPRPWTTAMIATEMPAAIRPYSIAVAPDSSWAKR
jgi:hypothetical protein